MSDDELTAHTSERKDFSVGDGWFEVRRPNSRIALNTDGNEFLEPELTVHFDPDSMENEDDANLHINAKDGGLLEAEAYVHLSHEDVCELINRLTMLEKAMHKGERYFER